MVEISGPLLRAALDAAPEGIVIAASRPAEQPIVYANPAFGRLTGYPVGELIGRDLRQLQAPERDGQDASQLHALLARGEGGRVQWCAARKDGASVWLDLQLQPLAGASDSPERHFIALARELSERERSGTANVPGLASWLREDRLSGLCSRAYFEQLMQRDWQIGLREARPLTLFAFDIDQLGSYNETYGRAGGDGCIRRVAGVIGASFRRGSDLVARWQGGCIVALVRDCDPATTSEFACAVAQKVLDQHIHHPRARRQKFVSVSVGVATVTPTAKYSPERLLRAALAALGKAKQDRQQRVAIAGPKEID